MTAPGHTLAELAAREAIRDLYARYADALDGNDYEAVAACLTPDVVIEMSDRAGRFDGRDCVLDLLRSVEEGRPRHVVTHMQIGPVGASVRVHAGFLLIDLGSGTLTGLGDYVDDVAASSEGWRLAHRRVTLRWSTAAFTERPAPDGST